MQKQRLLNFRVFTLKQQLHGSVPVNPDYKHNSHRHLECGRYWAVLSEGQLAHANIVDVGVKEGVQTRGRVSSDSGGISCGSAPMNTDVIVITSSF